MERKPRKFSLFQKSERLEEYLLAADNPVGKKQLRIIFRRKRSKELLTREQVTAIKRGRRLLRKEMKERGIKRRIDFEVTATNLGLYFDHKGLLWPIFLWLIRDNTVAKILAMTAVLTTLVTVTQPVIQYVTQYVNRYVNRYITQYLDKDRFTISVSDEMLKRGFELSEDPTFEEPQEILFAVPVTKVPCVSINSIPYDIDDESKYPNGTATDFFHYTFYCRYINKDAEKDSPANLAQYASDYKWGLRIHAEGVNTTADPGSTETQTEEAGATEEPQSDQTASGLKVSDAIWVMVIQDGEVILCAKEELDENGDAVLPILPTDEVLKKRKVAFYDRSIDYINSGLKQIDPDLDVDDLYDLYQVYSSEARIAQVQAQIDEFFEKEAIQNPLRILLRTANWREHYVEVPNSGEDGRSYYRIRADKFQDTGEKIVAEGTRTGMLPWIKGVNEEYHKYTVVAWLEGDDPQCTNELMDGYIGFNFQIIDVNGEYADNVTTATIPTETEPG